MADTQTNIVLSAVNKTGPAFDAAKRNMEALEKSAFNLGSAMGGIVGATTVYALSNWVKQSIDAADAMNDLAAATGTTVKALASIELIAKLNNTSLESVGKAMNKLGIWMEENAVAAKKLGITAKDPVERYAQLADAISSVEDASKRNRLANDILGKSYQEQMVLLRQGGDAIRDAVAASSYYADQVDMAAQQSGQFNDNLDILKQRASASAASLANDLLPALVAITGGMASASRDLNLFDSALVGLGQGGLVLQTMAVLANNLGFVFRVLENDAVAGMMQLGNVLMLRFEEAKKIGDQAYAYAVAQRKDLDELDARILGIKPPGSDAAPAKPNTKSGQAVDPDAARAAEDARKKAAAAYDQAVKSTADYIEKLKEETAAVGADTIQKKMLEAATKAMHAPNDNLKGQIMAQAAAWAQDTQAMLDWQEAAARNEKNIDNIIAKLDAKAMANSDSIATWEKKVKDIEFETTLLGMNNTEREKAIDLRQLEADKVKLTEEQYEMYRRRIIESIGAHNELKESIESQAEGWRSAESAGREAFRSWLDGGRDTAQRLRDAFKTMFFDALWQMFARPLVINVAAAISGSGVASAAFGASGGGSNILGTASNIASIYNMGSSLLLPGGASFGAGLYSLGGSLGSASLMGYGAGIEAASLGSVGVGATVIGAEGAAGSAAFAAGASGASSGIGAALASIPGWGWAAMAALALVGSGTFRKPGNEWGGVFATPTATDDPGLTDRIVATHGKDALIKGDSGLQLGATWKRTDGEQTKAALAAMRGIDTTLYGLTGASMEGKLAGQYYGYDKKNGGFLAGSKTVGSMDDVLAEFTKDWVQAADKVEALNKELVSSITGSADEVLKKTIAIVGMTADDMQKLFGESISIEKIKAVAKSGESAGDAFARLMPVFQATSHVAEILGKDASTAFGVAGLASSEARDRLVKLAGGLDALNASAASYYDLYFTDAEKQARATANMQAEFAKLNIAMPASKDGFRKLIEGLDLSTESGAKLYADLIKLAPAFAGIQDAAAEARQSLVDDAATAVDAARDKLQAAYDKEADALQSVIDKMGGFAKALKQFRESLLLGDLSPLSPLAKYDEAKRQFDDVSRRAALGDESAIEQLQTVSQAYLEASRAYNASNSQYVADFDRVQNVLRNTESVATRQANIAQQQLAAINQQVAGLIDINNSVLSVAAAISNLAAAMQQQSFVSGTGVGKSPAEGGSRVVSPTGVVQGRDGLRDANIVGLADSGDITGAISAAANYGYSARQTAQAYLAAHTDTGLSEDQVTANIIQYAKDNHIAGFASGGMHSGGLRLVGERGWEIEATGPARYWNQEQLGRAIAGSDNKETIAELRAIVAELRSGKQTQVDVGNKLADRLAALERRLDSIEDNGRLNGASGGRMAA